jgi:predicted RND superfamily exporter protein
MKQILIKTAHFVHHSYKYILVVSAVISVIAVALILNIEMNADMMDVMPADNPSMKLFAETMSELQRANALVLVIDSGSGGIEQHTEFIDRLTQRLTESSLIAAVDSSVFDMPREFMSRYFPLYLDDEGLALLEQKLSVNGINSQVRKNYRALTSFLSSPADAGLISDDPLDIRSLVKNSVLKKDSSGLDVSSGYYFSRDQKRAFVYVTPAGSVRNFAFLHKLKGEIKSISEKTLQSYGKPDRLTVESAGSYAVSWEAQESIGRDMYVSIFITVLLVLLIFRFIYRGRFAGLLIILLTILVSLLITLTSAFLLFGGLNIVTALVSAMLIGLGFDYTLHIFDRYVTEFRRHGNALQALETTYMNTGRSIVISAVTTSFAFFSIVITSFKGLHEMGLIAGIGILACMAASLVVLGSFLVLFSRGKTDLLIVQGGGSVLAESVPDFILKNGKWLLVSVCVIMLFLSTGILKLTFVSDISGIGLKKSRALELQNDLLEMSGKKGIPLILTYNGKKDVSSTFDEMDSTLQMWLERKTIGRYVSLGDILPAPYKQNRAINKLQGIDINDGTIEETFLSALSRHNFSVEDKNRTYIKNLSAALRDSSPFGIDDLPEALNRKAGMFYDSASGRMTAYIYPRQEKWDINGIAALREDIMQMDEGWQLTGWQLLESDLKSSIIKESLTAALLSFLFIIIILYVHFRKLLLIVLVQLPLVFGIVCTIGVMGTAGIGFNYINISAIAMIFGISVDYGVYFMQSFLEKRSSQDNWLVKHAFKNIVICSLTTMAGFGSLIFTNFRGISSLGQVIIIGIVSCLVMSALLLPVSDRLLKIKAH